jgi:hypothetical protein
VAHELGHLALRHVTEGDALVDEALQEPVAQAQLGPTEAPEERAANEFAVELLCGRPCVRYQATGRWPDARTLARDALRIGEREAIDPGHVVLNYARNMGSFYPVANAALNELPSTPTAQEILRERLAKYLDWSALPRESAEYLARLSGLESSAPPP